MAAQPRLSLCSHHKGQGSVTRRDLRCQAVGLVLLFFGVFLQQPSVCRAESRNVPRPPQVGSRDRSAELLIILNIPKLEFWEQGRGQGSCRCRLCVSAPCVTAGKQNLGLEQGLAAMEALLGRRALLLEQGASFAGICCQLPFSLLLEGFQ